MWFAIDEVDALGAIDGLADSMVRLRPFGGRCVLGFQSIGQVGTTFGHGSAEAIVENCSSSLILRCSASERGGTSRFASQLIGEREVVRTSQSRNRSDSWFSPAGHDTRGESEHYATEAAVYNTSNASSLINYGERYRAGERISSSLAESTVNAVISKRFAFALQKPQSDTLSDQLSKNVSERSTSQHR